MARFDLAQFSISCVGKLETSITESKKRTPNLMATSSFSQSISFFESKNLDKSIDPKLHTPFGGSGCSLP
jgi:hypothetical protein